MIAAAPLWRTTQQVFNSPLGNQVREQVLPSATALPSFVANATDTLQDAGFTKLPQWPTLWDPQRESLQRLYEYLFAEHVEGRDNETPYGSSPQALSYPSYRASFSVMA
jgi:hypothetical protein